MGAAQIPPLRKQLEKLKSSGDGPSAEERAKAWFTVTFVGEGGGQRVVCRVKGGDPGYGETAKMLAESALCLAFDDLPETAGQVTTAQAMGGPLTARLQAAGHLLRRALTTLKSGRRHPDSHRVSTSPEPTPLAPAGARQARDAEERRLMWMLVDASRSRSAR